MTLEAGMLELGGALPSDHSATYAYYKSKMPAQKAIVVIARKMLKLIYKVLQEKSNYCEGGKQLYLMHEAKRLKAREWARVHRASVA